jgi:hypothetical protein
MKKVRSGVLRKRRSRQRPDRIGAIRRMVHNIAQHGGHRSSATVINKRQVSYSHRLAVGTRHVIGAISGPFHRESLCEERRNRCQSDARKCGARRSTKGGRENALSAVVDRRFEPGGLLRWLERCGEAPHGEHVKRRMTGWFYPAGSRLESDPVKAGGLTRIRFTLRAPAMAYST